MNQLRRLSLFLWLVLSHLPPISPGRLLMPAVFLSSWTVLRFLHFPEPAAFVWAGVLAQAAQLCSVLPVTVWRLRKAFGRARTGARWSVAFYFCVFAFQVWLSDPVISQRLVSIICGIYVMVMALGVKGDPAILNYFAPAANEMDVPLNFRRHLLKLYALMAMLVVASNASSARCTAGCHCGYTVPAAAGIALFLCNHAMFDLSPIGRTRHLMQWMLSFTAL